MALPAAVEYGQVKWAVVSAVADGVDSDALPDAVPVTGDVTFTPSATVLLATGGSPITIIATAVTYSLDSSGVLRDSEGRNLIALVATNSAGITPTGWTWTCSYRLNNGAARGSFSFDLPSGTTVDLTSVAPVSSSNGVPIIQGPAGPAGPTGATGPSGGGGGGTADYLVTVSGSTITATPRSGSGLTTYTGTDASTVLQSAITALTPAGARGSGGGHIHIARGVYNLGNEVTITGWEGIAGPGGAPESQLVITGDGYSTQLVQNTAGQNGIVVKNLANFAFRDFRMFTGASGKSCLLGASNGAISEMSCWGSLIDNVSFVTNSSTAPAVLMRNFFSLHIPKATFTAPNYHAFMVVNDSPTTNYGNSHFGQIGAFASTSSPYAGLHFSTTTTANFPNLITVDNYQCGSAYYGIYAKGLKFSTFLWVDIEGIQRPIYFDGGTTGYADESRNNTLVSGYLLPTNPGTAITCATATGGNDFSCVIAASGASIPIVDQQQYRPRNRYDVSVGSQATVDLIQVTDTVHTQITAALTDGSVVRLDNSAG